MIPLLQTLPDIAGQTLTVDALPTQRKLARHLLEREAHDVFTAENCSHHCLDWTRVGRTTARARGFHAAFRLAIRGR